MPHRLATPLRLLLIPKHRVDAKLMHFVDQHDEVVAQDFAHGLVFHGRRPFAGVR